MSPSSRGLRRSRTRLEWTVLAVSLASVATVMVGLIVAGLAGGDGGPDLRVTVRSTGIERSGGVEYEVTIQNRGGHTAENVVVEVTLGEETRELQILSVSKDDQEVASVVFPPGTTGEASASVLSYHETTRG